MVPIKITTRDGSPYVFLFVSVIVLSVYPGSQKTSCFHTHLSTILPVFCVRDYKSSGRDIHKPYPTARPAGSGMSSAEAHRHARSLPQKHLSMSRRILPAHCSWPQLNNEYKIRVIGKEIFKCSPARIVTLPRIDLSGKCIDSIRLDRSLRYERCGRHIVRFRRCR